MAVAPIAHPETSAGPAAGFSPLALSVALGLLALLTVSPGLLCHADGRVDYPATLLLVWAMCAGFVRGVGFVPEPLPLRLAFSRTAVVAALLLAVLRLGGNGIPFLF